MFFCFKGFYVFFLRTAIAPRHLGNEINQQRVDGVTEAFLELLQQNVPELPPGSINAASQNRSFVNGVFFLVFWLGGLDGCGFLIGLFVLGFC